MDGNTSFKPLLFKIIIPFLLVIVSGIILLHVLEASELLIRPMIIVYYGVFLGTIIPLYYIIVEDLDS